MWKGLHTFKTTEFWNCLTLALPGLPADLLWLAPFREFLAASRHSSKGTWLRRIGEKYFLAYMIFTWYLLLEQDFGVNFCFRQKYINCDKLDFAPNQCNSQQFSQKVGENFFWQLKFKFGKPWTIWNSHLWATAFGGSLGTAFWWGRVCSIDLSDGSLPFHRRTNG